MEKTMMLPAMYNVLSHNRAISRKPQEPQTPRAFRIDSLTGLPRKI